MSIVVTFYFAYLFLVSYSFRLTPTPGSFEKSRLLCNEMGGDLIFHNLDHQGSSRHGYVLLTSNIKTLTIYVNKILF